MRQGDATEQIEGIRRQAVAVLGEMMAKAGEFELADPPAALDRYRKKLRENAYKVLVVGEAKRGKSTFVNALIGRDVLPTDVDIATSQVFSIRPCEKEAYRLRFEDGSKREISPEDLPLYGSQVMADAGVVPSTDQIIRWIEVDAPIRFLPEGVSILDTPGLGALYASHAQITYRFVPEADAVIYVLDSAQPVVHAELKFIEEILNVTRNVFFVQTKIDLFGTGDWQEVQRRNQEVLKERFGGQLADTRVWPVSSKLLLAAASGGEDAEEDLEDSRHAELMGALQAFLARVAGWSRAAEAMTAAVRYHTTSRNALAGRLAGLAAESKQKHSELQKAATENKQRFDAEWGPRGEKTRELQQGLQRIVAVGKQSFVNALQQGGDIELAQKAKIDAIESLDDANRVAREMGDEVITAAANKWVLTCKEAQYQCAELLEPLVEAIEELSAPVDTNMSGLAIQDGGADDKFKTDYFVLAKGAQGGAMLVTGVGSMLGAGVTVFSGGLALLALPALVVLVRKGVTGARKGQVKQAQGQLRQQLTETLQKVRRHFFDVDLTAGRFSRVDEYFKNLDRTVNEQVRETIEKKSKDAQAEIARLNQAAQLDGRERDARAKQTQEQLAGWDRIGKSAGAVTAQIKALQTGVLQRPKAPIEA